MEVVRLFFDGLLDLAPRLEYEDEVALAA
jgi:hypothetical protein